MEAPCLRWTFPLNRVHTGMPLGNGLTGVLVWGAGDELHLTLGRADLWDHRSAKRWTEAMNYADIRRLLEAGDEAGLRARFAEVNTPGRPRRPTLMPLGRLTLHFPRCKLRQGRLNLADGQVRVGLVDAAGRKHTVKIDVSVDADAVWVRLPEGVPCTCRLRPAWEFLRRYMESVGIAPPQPMEGDTPGWVQALPEDPAVAVALAQRGRDVVVAVDRGGGADEARQAALKSLQREQRRGRRAVRQANCAWWAGIWRSAPRIQTPNATLNELYQYGLYRFAAMTNPRGVAAGLQGPWIEDDRLPPWSGDYHFNINVQMCYAPAYRGNLLHHLRPLWSMLAGWMPTLRENARRFCGVDDGLMLPHSVDDRCGIIGAFWTGTIDHACTGWAAKMIHDAARFAGDDELLGERAVPFMRGALRVYQAMIEERDGAMGLPVTVSPEYRGAAMNARGANASFQLACVHWLVEALSSAADRLGTPRDAEWAAISERLPRACLIGDERHREIALWNGVGLEESHRHHSHLAGLYPFDVIDTGEPAWRDIARRSMETWIRRGMGMWTGWCISWAAVLHMRFGHGEMAELLLELLRRVWMNEGRGPLHNAHIRGLSAIVEAPVEQRTGEIMQMDALMGGCAAVLEMFVHTRRGVHHFLAGVPRHWRRASFRGIRCEGGVLADGELRRGRVIGLRLRAECDSDFRLADPISGAVRTVRLPKGGVWRWSPRHPEGIFRGATP